MVDADRTRQRAVQNRTLVTRGKIAEGAIQVLAHSGVPGLTHRAVAQAAGVSLAATTYHFDAKPDIIEEASRTLLDGYLAAFRRMAGRIASGEETRIASLDDLVERVVLNALGRERIRSLAWSELILHGGRSPVGRALAQRWYEQLDSIWREIGELTEPGTTTSRASAAVDLTVGLTFFLHPLGLDQASIAAVLAGRLNPEPLLAKATRSRGARAADTRDDEAPTRYAETRQKIVDAAIEIIVEDGVAGISYARVADVAGMVRSGPSYYFATIDELVETADAALFERARERYRAGLASTDTAAMDEGKLLDLTTAIYFREALEFGRENIGHYSVWMSAAQNPSLRPAVAASLRDMHRAWLRRIAVVAGREDVGAAMRMQSMFIGKLVRAITASVDIADLSRTRDDFALVLNGRRKTRRAIK
ncbi:MAG TPA: TetR family transcriptional regulator [Bauldia sp.]|nr:TetR family transcriptional regulator [Bauldia sp.]